MLETFIKRVKDNNWQIYGIEIFFQGRIVDAYDFVPAQRRPIYSATKAFTSTAVGLAVDEGRFSIDAPIYDYIKDELPIDISEKQLQVLHKMSIKRLLTMSVPGYPFRLESEKWLDEALTYPIRFNSTPVFHYSNIPAYLVGVAVEKAVGQHLATYLESRLWDPLGIKKPDYMNCPSGHFYGASGMKLTVNELSRLGQLYLQKGRYEGKQILSEKWVNEATAIQQMSKEGGYGYYFWKYKDGAQISGKWGQKCCIFPEQQLMITYLAEIKDDPDAVLLTMEKEILPFYGM
jgi:CubicO group peptidase (beta-lactamase class C family)